MKSNLPKQNSKNIHSNFNQESRINKPKISKKEDNIFFDKTNVQIKYSSNNKQLRNFKDENYDIASEYNNKDKYKDEDRNKIKSELNINLNTTDYYNPWENTKDILKLNNDSKYLINELELKGITTLVKNSDVNDCVNKFKNKNLKSILNPEFKRKSKIDLDNDFNNNQNESNIVNKTESKSFFPKVNSKDIDLKIIEDINTHNMHSIHKFYVMEKASDLIELFYNELSNLEEYYQQNKYSSILCKNKDFIDSDNITNLIEYIGLLNRNELKLASLINNIHLTYNTHIDIKYESHFKFLLIIKQLITRTNMFYLDELKNLNMRWIDEMISDTKDLVDKLKLKNIKKDQLIELDNVIT